MTCTSCGAISDSRDRFCAACGVSLQIPIAHLGRRILAAILDFIVIWCLISVIVILLPPRLLEDAFARKGPAQWIVAALCCLGLAYYIVFEALLCATPGKIITGIQVRLRDREDCDFRASLLRNLVRMVDAVAGYLVGFIAAMLSDSRQRLGDLVAGTIVVLRPSAFVVRVLLLVGWLAFVSGAFVACQVVRH